MLSSSCETDDPRVALSPGSQPASEGPGDDPSARGFAELCGDNTPACRDGLSCYEGVCTPTAYASACTPNPCGESGLCNARGDIAEDGTITGENIVVICRCIAPNEEWDGATCRASADESGFPAFSGSVLAPGETCPGPDAQPDVPGATDCPAETFCDATASGRCLQYGLSLVGSLGGRDIDVRAEGSEATRVECIREYVPAEAAADGEAASAPSGDSAGVKLVFTAAVAEAISPGALSISIDVSNGDVLGGLPFLILPQVNAPAPRGDSVIANLRVDGTDLAAIGGRVTLDSVSGPDENDDNLIDDDAGAIGGTFFLGFADGQFLAGAFVVPCGQNESVPPP
ncbi:MAG TPA: hypothetical protein VMG12_07290 [Polyangiaceae bacterium]|nr:hypothetical protein [Polyangiaceae bacterium]